QAGRKAGTESGREAGSLLSRDRIVLLKLAGNASKDINVKLIIPHRLQLALHGDEKSDSLIKATVVGGGVIPHMHKSLVGKKGQQKTVEMVLRFLIISGL
uniref:Histone H2A n=1 Tax=Neovison vison TaxID=452646 RepID=A0A8C7ACX2_NEOVI